MGNGVAAEILLMLAGDFPGGSRNTHLNRPEGPNIPVVDRLLDPKNDITLGSLQRAAAMVGRRVNIELV